MCHRVPACIQHYVRIGETRATDFNLNQTSGFYPFIVKISAFQDRNDLTQIKTPPRPRGNYSIRRVLSVPNLDERGMFALPAPNSDRQRPSWGRALRGVRRVLSCAAIVVATLTLVTFVTVETSQACPGRSHSAPRAATQKAIQFI